WRRHRIKLRRWVVLLSASRYDGKRLITRRCSRSDNQIMRDKTRSLLLRYGMAVLSTTASSLLVELFRPIFIPAPFLPFIVAVVVSAWYGGLGPGILATILGVLASDFLIVQPFYSLGTGNPADMVRSGLFLATGASISWLMEGLHAARRTVQTSA